MSKSGSIHLLISEEFKVQTTGLTNLEEFLLKTKSVNGVFMGQRSARSRLATRAYLVATFAFSLYVCFGNLAKRNNWYQRVTDMVAVITILWFTVFGLIKLQSDDEKIVRNLVFGKKPIYHEDELVEHLNEDCRLPCNLTDIKIALSRVVRDYNWLSSRDCCFIKGQTEGKMEILGGLDAYSCDRAGLLEVNEVIDDRSNTGRVVVFDVTNNMFGVGEKKDGRLHVTKWMASKDKWFLVNRVPENCGIR